MEVRKFRKLLNELNKLGYIVVLEYHVMMVKHKVTGDVIAEIHSDNSLERKTQLGRLLEELKKD